MTTTQRTFVEPRTATPDEAGWRFTTTGAARVEGDAADHTPARRPPSLSWRLRH